MSELTPVEESTFATVYEHIRELNDGETPGRELLLLYLELSLPGLGHSELVRELLQTSEDKINTEMFLQIMSALSSRLRPWERLCLLWKCLHLCSQTNETNRLVGL